MLRIKLCPHTDLYMEANGYVQRVELDCRECGALYWTNDPSLIPTIRPRNAI